MKPVKKAKILNGCVACGACAKACPAGALSVYKGMYASVNKDRCVGCGKCAFACPAGIIVFEEAVCNEKAALV